MIESIKVSKNKTQPQKILKENVNYKFTFSGVNTEVFGGKSSPPPPSLRASIQAERWGQPPSTQLSQLIIEAQTGVVCKQVRVGCGGGQVGGGQSKRLIKQLITRPDRFPLILSSDRVSYESCPRPLRQHLKTLRRKLVICTALVHLPSVVVELGVQ